MQWKQETGQTVEEFIAKVRKQGNLIGASQNEIYMAVITGLRHDLKAQIMQWDPVTIEDVIKRGRVAERYPITRAYHDNSGRTDEISKLMRTVNEISDKLTTPVQRARSTTPPRVRFEEIRNQDQGTQNRPLAREQTPTRFETQGRPPTPPQHTQQTYNATNTNREQDRPSYQTRYNDQQRFDQPRPWQQRGTYRQRFNDGPRYTGNRYGNEQQAPGASCSSCGRNHEREERCPARGTTCGMCGKMNHWRICCRGGRGGGYQRGNTYNQQRNTYNQQRPTDNRQN